MARLAGLALEPLEGTCRAGGIMVKRPCYLFPSVIGKAHNREEGGFSVRILRDGAALVWTVSRPGGGHRGGGPLQSAAQRFGEEGQQFRDLRRARRAPEPMQDFQDPLLDFVRGQFHGKSRVQGSGFRKKAAVIPSLSRDLGLVPSAGCETRPRCFDCGAPRLRST